MEAWKQVFDRRDTVSKYEGVLDAESVKFGTNFSAVGQLKANNNEQTMSAYLNNLTYINKWSWITSATLVDLGAWFLIKA